MTDTEQRAREALDAQGIRNPGPKLTRLVVDAIAREQEGAMPGQRTHQFDYAAILADTPELLDRTTGPMTNPGTESSYAIADVINNAIGYIFDNDESDS